MDMIVTTEKDAVRLEKPEEDPEVPIYFLRIEVEIYQGREAWNVVWTASAEFQNRAHGMNGNLPHLSEQERSSLRQYIKKIVNMRCTFS